MEALPPPPPPEIAQYNEQIPDLSDPIVIEPNTLNFPVHTEVASIQTDLSDTPDTIEAAPESTRLDRIKSSKIGKVIMNEGIGTALDVASMAVGVPLPVREVAGSTLDSVVYGSESPETERNPSRMHRVAKRVGSVALFAVAGMVAQKFGSEAADVVYDKLNHGALGEYVTPLASKMGAIPVVNSAINRLSR